MISYRVRSSLCSAAGRPMGASYPACWGFLNLFYEMAKVTVSVAEISLTPGSIGTADSALAALTPS